jgi:hypothetical protein
MPITHVSSRSRLLGRRGAVVLGLLGLVAALSYAVYSKPEVGAVAASSVTQAFKTVATLLAERSPGVRPEGALASLKPARQPAIHERALPKVRGPLPLAEVPGGETPPPLYDLLAAPPLVALTDGPPIGILPPAGIIPGTFHGPPSTGGGGGGGIVILTVIPLAPPEASAVPEPSTWAMMLAGFAMIGRRIRRRKVHRKPKAT